MPVFKDQMGREVVIDDSPQRIVSLVPSQTELLYDLGLGDRVVGITKFCIHPDTWFRSKTRIGGTKTVDFDKVKLLNPDLIIGNKEENTKEDIEQLQAHFPVWMSDIYSVTDALKMIESVGEITDKSDQAKQICQRIESSLMDFPRLLKNRRVLYLIWRDPYMAAGNDTFIHALLEDVLGGMNVVDGQGRYPEVDLANLSEKPDLLLLSSEPYPFKEKHIEEIQAILPQARVLLVDGEYFSWYGSRLQGTASYLRKLFEL